MDLNNLYRCALSESLPLDENKFDKIVILEDMLKTPDVSIIEFFVEVDSRSPDEMKDKTRKLPLCPENKPSPQIKFSGYLIEMKPIIYTQSGKFLYQ